MLEFSKGYLVLIEARKESIVALWSRFSEQLGLSLKPAFVVQGFTNFPCRMWLQGSCIPQKSPCVASEVENSYFNGNMLARCNSL